MHKIHKSVVPCLCIFPRLTWYHVAWYHVLVSRTAPTACRQSKTASTARNSQGGGPRKEVLLVYTEYGYTVNGIEYSTIDEALEAQRADDDD